MNPFRWFRERREEKARQQREELQLQAYLRHREELQAYLREYYAAKQAQQTVAPTILEKATSITYASPKPKPASDDSGPDVGTVILGAVLLNELLGNQPQPPTSGDSYIPASAPCESSPDATGFSEGSCSVPDFSVGDGGMSGGGGADASFDPGPSTDFGSSGGFDSGSSGSGDY